MSQHEAQNLADKINGGQLDSFAALSGARQWLANPPRGFE